MGKVDLPVFLQQKLKAKKGDIIEIPASWEGYGATANDDMSVSADLMYTRLATGRQWVNTTAPISLRSDSVAV